MPHPRIPSYLPSHFNMCEIFIMNTDVSVVLVLPHSTYNPGLYTGLYRSCTIPTAVQAWHDTQGCTGPAVYAVARQALHYTLGIAGCVLYAALCRTSTIRRALKALHYSYGCEGPALYAGL